MPFSSNSGKSWIERLVKRLIKICTHNSILDVGAGTGIYSELLRGKLQGTHFTAIEIWEPYITQFVLDTKYDVVINADIREFIPEQRYGIIMLGDILEHMTKEEAVDIYNKLLNSSEFVIISIPIIYYPQDA